MLLGLGLLIALMVGCFYFKMCSGVLSTPEILPFTIASIPKKEVY